MEKIFCGKWSAVVAPECGNNVISLICAGEEILRRPESPEALFARPCLYGMPLLLPANRLEDACFRFEGKEYTLPINEPSFHNHIHGLVKDAPFRVVDRTDTTVSAILENAGEYYPFPFEITITDSITEDGFVRKICLKNTGSGTMPYTIGFHTTFAEPERFCVPIGERCEMDSRYLPTGSLLPLTAQQRAYRDGMQPDGSKISGVYRSTGDTVQLGKYAMRVSGQFDHWVLFNGNGQEGYLCIEPQCGAVNGLRSAQHCVIKPGDREMFTVSFLNTNDNQ